MEEMVTCCPIDACHELSRDGLIEKYFKMGFKYLEIILFLSVFHGFDIGLRQLKRVLNKRGLFRRLMKDDVATVIDHIEAELRGSGQTLGYRAMHKKLIQVHQLITDRETVRTTLKLLDPSCVLSRRQRRLNRREYSSLGPNYIWHVDGWDKLKPYGFCIHGCIDGFSRKLIWLEIGSSNNDPYQVCSNFLHSVVTLGGVPYIVRADRGTENGNIEMIQTHLRSLNGDARGNLMSSFIYGRSTANQRIEAWWSKIKPQGMDFWVNHFKELVGSGILDMSDEASVQCVRFCYMDLLRQEIQVIKYLWNTHHIRKTRNDRVAHGKPEVMYHFPEIYNARDHIRKACQEDLELVTCSLSRDVPDCQPEGMELFTSLMEDSNLLLPTSVTDADDLFVYLMDKLDDLVVV